jgi:hypothetical protein
MNKTPHPKRLEALRPYFCGLEDCIPASTSNQQPYEAIMNEGIKPQAMTFSDAKTTETAMIIKKTPMDSKSLFAELAMF